METTVFFLNATHGWVGNTTTIGSRSEEIPPLLRTTDVGKTWSVAGRWPGNWVCDTQFQDADTGYCVDMGGIYSTKDGGRSWHRELDSNAEPLCQLVSVGQSRRWVLTSTGNVYTYSPKLHLGRIESSSDHSECFTCEQDGGWVSSDEYGAFSGLEKWAMHWFCALRRPLIFCCRTSCRGPTRM